ncbi:MAG TPA: hypothetical protein VLK23_14885, partial [Thermodesulfobacteriota bacterium]|nr:hypothetical protein [Thermodesulfobacteriota bacterium]
RAGRSKERVLAFFSCLITQIQDRKSPIPSCLKGTSFSGSKQLVYEDQIFTLLSSSAGGSFGKKSAG